MNNRRLLARIERVESLLATQGIVDEAPLDVSVTLETINSLTPHLIRLSEIDQKRWYCPDDPRSLLSSEEIQQELEIKARILVKYAILGFPNGYGQRQYRKDGIRLRHLSEKQKDPDFIRYSASEQAEMTVIRARRELIYEVGPQHRASLRAMEICEGKEFIERPTTLCEEHQLDHLRILHSREPLDAEEIAALDYSSRMLHGIGKNIEEMLGDRPQRGLRARLDEWHARKGEDPRLFKSFPTWQQFPCWTETLLRQNQQLAEMGFEPDTTSCNARRILKEIEEGNREA